MRADLSGGNGFADVECVMGIFPFYYVFKEWLFGRAAAQSQKVDPTANGAAQKDYPNQEVSNWV